eukprot:GHUV01021213.1.p1 GENE.GHUV01021213.1~~GHUV01021213.1.p1  ORF type:complete len:314 (+),score=43.25 GHUV01021213.1:284-1225(+)
MEDSPEVQQQHQQLEDRPTASSPSQRYKRTSSGGSSRDINGVDPSSGGNGSSSDSIKGLLKFPPNYLFTCSVGRSRSKARYSLSGSNDVGGLLEAVIRQAIHGLPLEEPSDSASSDHHRSISHHSISHHNSQNHHGISHHTGLGTSHPSQRDRDGTSGGGASMGGTSSVTSGGGTGYTSGTISGTSSVGGVGPGVGSGSYAIGGGTGDHIRSHKNMHTHSTQPHPGPGDTMTSGTEAILRAVEAASAQRRHRQQLQQHYFGGQLPYANREDRRSSSDGPGFISQVCGVGPWDGRSCQQIKLCSLHVLQELSRH